MLTAEESSPISTNLICCGFVAKSVVGLQQSRDADKSKLMEFGQTLAERRDAVGRIK